MPIEMSNKVFLITEKTRIASPIKIALNRIGLEIAADYPALTSIPVMRTGIAKSGKTAFIRTALLRFIKEKGFPRAVIIDSHIDLGVESAPDPDTLKILKTFMIAYVILSKGAEWKDLYGKFIILTRGNAFEKETGIGGNPHNAMKLLSTQNPEINFFIDELKENRDRFDALFSINLLDTDLSSDVITDTVAKLLIQSAPSGKVSPDAVPVKPAKDIAEDKPEERTVVTGRESDGDKPARILYRIDADSVYDDGEILTELTEEHASLKEREFYVIGTWSSKTELEVSKKIAAIVQKGISEKARFGYGDKITFNLDDRCIIDKNTTLSVAQLFTKNLAVFKKIAITASAKNGELIQKSRGFPMIRDIFTVLP